MHADCIFTDWLGGRSPLAALYGGLANVVDTVFRNMILNVEVADVSYNGVVRFQNVSFANVTLAHGVVSTTDNDYSSEYNFNVEYYAADDANYDVEVDAVAIGERGMFGAEFVITEAVMSNCVYLLSERDKVLPGCAEASVQQRAAMIRRQRTETPSDGDGGGEQVTDYNTGDPDARLEEDLPLLTDPWLQALQASVGPLPPPPATWPPFAVPPPATPENRSDISRLPGPVVEVPVPGLQADAAAVAAADEAIAAAATAGGGDGRDSTGRGVVIVAVAIAALAAGAVAAAVWAVLALRRKQPHQPYLEPAALAAERRRRRLHLWMSAGEGTASVRSPSILALSFWCFCPGHRCAAQRVSRLHHQQARSCHASSATYAPRRYSQRIRG